MGKKAVIVISLVPESKTIDNERIERAVYKTLRCDWLAGVEKVAVKNGEYDAGFSFLRGKSI